MKVRSIFTTVTLFAMSLLFVARPAQAATLVLTGTGLGEYPVPLLTNHGSGLQPQDAYAGQILITLNGVAGIAYCVDLFTDIGLETYNSIYGTPSDYTNGLRAAWIFTTYAAAVANNADGAALQLALWDVIHDGGDGLSAGDVQLAPAGSSTLRSATEALVLASVGQSSANAKILYPTDLGGTPAQALITINSPEPASWALMAAGAALIAALRRRPRPRS